MLCRYVCVYRYVCLIVCVCMRVMSQLSYRGYAVTKPAPIWTALRGFRASDDVNRCLPLSYLLWRRSGRSLRHRLYTAFGPCLTPAQASALYIGILPGWTVERTPQGGPEAHQGDRLRHNVCICNNVSGRRRGYGPLPLRDRFCRVATPSLLRHVM